MCLILVLVCVFRIFEFSIYKSKTESNPKSFGATEANLPSTRTVDDTLQEVSNAIQDVSNAIQNVPTATDHIDRVSDAAQDTSSNGFRFWCSVLVISLFFKL